MNGINAKVIVTPGIENNFSITQATEQGVVIHFEGVTRLRLLKEMIRLRNCSDWSNVYLHGTIAPRSTDFLLRLFQKFSEEGQEAVCSASTISTRYRRLGHSNSRLRDVGKEMEGVGMHFTGSKRYYETYPVYKRKQLPHPRETKHSAT